MRSHKAGTAYELVLFPCRMSLSGSAHAGHTRVRRCGPQAAVHLVGKALLNFQLSGEDAADAAGAATPTRGSGRTSRAESLAQLSELVRELDSHIRALERKSRSRLPFIHHFTRVG